MVRGAWSKRNRRGSGGLGQLCFGKDRAIDRRKTGSTNKERNMSNTQTFTPANIAERINEVGPWSLFYLAEIAFKHYYPETIKGNSYENVEKMDGINKDWQGVVIKY